MTKDASTPSTTNTVMLVIFVDGKLRISYHADEDAAAVQAKKSMYTSAWIGATPADFEDITLEQVNAVLAFMAEKGEAKAAKSVEEGVQAFLDLAVKRGRIAAGEVAAPDDEEGEGDQAAEPETEAEEVDVMSEETDPDAPETKKAAKPAPKPAPKKAAPKPVAAKKPAPPVAKKAAAATKPAPAAKKAAAPKAKKAAAPKAKKAAKANGRKGACPLRMVPIFKALAKAGDKGLTIGELLPIYEKQGYPDVNRGLYLRAGLFDHPARGSLSLTVAGKKALAEAEAAIAAEKGK